MDCRSGKLDCRSQIEQDAEKPLHYVVGFDEQGFVKDVTPKYCSDWMTKTKKLRYDCCHSDDPWWCTTLMPYTDKVGSFENKIYIVFKILNIYIYNHVNCLLKCNQKLCFNINYRSLSC